jgi:hypothetical protein
MIAALDQQVAAPTVTSAYATERGIVFDAPVPVAWDSLLPDSLQPRALRANSARRLALFEQRTPEYGTTEVFYVLPVPPLLEGRFYYLLDSTGLIETRPDSLLGTARIRWAGPFARVETVNAFGQVRVLARRAASGGFILSSDRRLTLAVAPSDLSADALLAPGGGTYLGRGTAFRQILRQYEVREAAPETRRWIWVQWLPDTALLEAGCQFRFTLFQHDLQPAPIASTDYGCDV